MSGPQQMPGACLGPNQMSGPCMDPGVSNGFQGQMPGSTPNNRELQQCQPSFFIVSARHHFFSPLSELLFIQMFSSLKFVFLNETSQI